MTPAEKIRYDVENTERRIQKNVVNPFADTGLGKFEESLTRLDAARAYLSKTN